MVSSFHFHNILSLILVSNFQLHDVLFWGSIVLSKYGPTLTILLSVCLSSVLRIGFLFHHDQTFYYLSDPFFFHNRNLLSPAFLCDLVFGCRVFCSWITLLNSQKVIGSAIDQSWSIFHAEFNGHPQILRLVRLNIVIL